jgi:hypothetical protein
MSTTRVALSGAWMAMTSTCRSRVGGPSTRCRGGSGSGVLRRVRAFPAGGIDAQNLGQNEDWVGNNIAVTCPWCGKAHIVSQLVHYGERICPRYRTSVARVTGSSAKGGVALIEGVSEGQIAERKIDEEIGEAREFPSSLGSSGGVVVGADGRVPRVDRGAVDDDPNQTVMVPARRGWNLRQLDIDCSEGISPCWRRVLDADRSRT